MSHLEQIDVKLFFLINKGMQNSFFDLLMPFVTNFRNWWPVIVPSVILLLIRGGRKGRVAVIVIAITIGPSDYSSGKVLKHIFSRLRPCNVLDGVHLLSYCSKYGFPSSHASNMAALTIIVSYYYRKMLVPLIILAVIIGYSRVYVGVHYPFDVLGGYVWGSLVAAGVIWLERKMLDVRHDIIVGRD